MIMDITYTWKITNMKRMVSNGCVFMVEYDIIGTDGQYTASTSCGTCLEMPPSEDLLISFEDLTEEMVLGWVKNLLTGNSIPNLQQEVIDKIELLRNPVEAEGLPWQ